MCPRCRQNAPIVYRGMMAYCTACGAPRPPLTGTSINLAGQPSKLGGAVASVLGWVVLAAGLSVALMLGLIAQALFPAGFVGLALGLPIALLTTIVAVVLLRSGKSLRGSGASAEKTARVQAIYALAAHRGGALTALDVAQSLGIQVDEADALLTTLTKEQMDHVGIEIDPNGGLFYRFSLPGLTRVDAGRVRVDPEVARSPNRAEWERLEAEEAAAPKDARRAPRPR
jgi:hypothetical protein